MRREAIKSCFQELEQTEVFKMFGILCRIFTKQHNSLTSSLLTGRRRFALLLFVPKHRSNILSKLSLHHSTQTTNEGGRDEISLAKGLTRIPPQRRGEGWRGKRDTPTNYQAIIYLGGGERRGGGHALSFSPPFPASNFALTRRGEGGGHELGPGESRQFVICGVFGGEGR